MAAPAVPDQIYEILQRAETIAVVGLSITRYVPATAWPLICKVGIPHHFLMPK